MSIQKTNQIIAKMPEVSLEVVLLVIGGAIVITLIILAFWEPGKEYLAKIVGDISKLISPVA